MLQPPCAPAVDGNVHSGNRENHLFRFSNVFAMQGQYNEAEKMYQRALQGYEKARGLEHTSTLDTVNNLGNLYWKLGRLDDAEKMFQQALSGFEISYDFEHEMCRRFRSLVELLDVEHGT
jgi:tetratricopeptide (TPR) repeat protein